MIQIEHVSKTFHTRFEEVHALQDVSIKVEKGDIFGVIGYSGAGKSTLIRMVNLLEKPDQGNVFIEGKNITDYSSKKLNRLRKEIGMVFQQFNLLESQTVFQNIAIPLILEKYNKQDIKKRVYELLDFVGLKDKSDVYVSQLSGGQKQRIGIARALATNPKILLCDEATSALDPETTESILLLLKKINIELNITILLITHEMNVIKKICNKVAVMENGKICEQGDTIKLFSNPQQEITKKFVKTVINSSISETILRNLDYADPIVKLTFFGENSQDSVVSQINKQFNVTTTILFASVNEIQNTVLGILILQLQGNKNEIDKAEKYVIKRGIAIERVVTTNER